MAKTNCVCFTNPISKTETGYSHLEKKALAVVFGIKRFHKYVFGREFTIYSDHLIAPEGLTRPSAAARMQSFAFKRWHWMLWILLLAAYRVTPGSIARDNTAVANADALSRIPLKNPHDAMSINSSQQCRMCPIQTQCEEKRRKTLSKVKRLAFKSKRGNTGNVFG